MQPDLDAAPDRKFTLPPGGAVKFILALAAVLVVVFIVAIFGSKKYERG